MKEILENPVSARSLKDEILISNYFIDIPLGNSKGSTNIDSLGTIFSNLAYYGYVLSKSSVERLLTLGNEELEEWWKKTDQVLSHISGDSRKMDKHVVYKNFPAEILEMSESRYWFNQILMYWGFPNELFTEKEKERAPLLISGALKVLHLSNKDSLKTILKSLLSSTTQLNSLQMEYVYYLVGLYKSEFTFQEFPIPFKQNLVSVIKYLMDNDIQVILRSATDVMRLATILSIPNEILTPGQKVKFKSFSKAHRRFLLGLLENSSSLDEDMARDVEKWKRLIRSLHPSEYRSRFPNVFNSSLLLYNDEIKSFNSVVEVLIQKKDPEVFNVLNSRPGEFMRRIKNLSLIFPSRIIQEFQKTSERFKVGQLLKVKKYLETCNSKNYRTYPPKGNWNKVKIVSNNITQLISEDIRISLLEITKKSISTKMSAHFPNGVLLDEKTKNIKISSSDSALYGRGTIFDIPEGSNFIRTASYWEMKTNGNNWFDNGWNFFDSEWNPKGTVCWDSLDFGKKAAIFSGDPTNSKTEDGKACQMIDLYLDKLEKSGIRYAVWNILCYSGIKFSDATDVFASLQWGTDAMKGKLFEPSRCQIAFPIKDNSLTKFIAYIDIQERKLIFLDANLKGDKSSASRNEKLLGEKMPALVEYMNSIPSVYDIFEGVKEGETFILYSDINMTLSENENAYVFKPENENNKFSQIDINKYL